MDRGRGNYGGGNRGRGDGSRGQNPSRGQRRGQGQGPVRGQRQYQGSNRGPNQGPNTAENPTGSPRGLKLPSTIVKDSENAIRPDPNVGNNGTIPPRPAYGTQAKSRELLWANYVELGFKPEVVLWKYEADFGAPQNTEPTGKKLARIMSLLLQEIQEPGNSLVTDFSKIIISLKEIEQIKAAGTTRVVRYYNENEKPPDPKDENTKTYQIKVELKLTLPLSEVKSYLSNPTTQYLNKESMLQALNIFLNYYAKNSDKHMTIGTGRSFPIDKKFSRDIGSGLIAVKGYYSSIRLATARILANINVSYGIFYPHWKLDTLMETYCNGKNDEITLRRLGRFLRGIRIKYICPNVKGKPTGEIQRVCRIHGLATTQDGMAAGNQSVDMENPPEVKKYGAGPADVKFWYRDQQTNGVYITVLNFFQKHREKISKTKLPVVNIGSGPKPAYLPAELCTVLPGQRAKVEGDTDQTKNMIRFAVRRPFDDMKDIVPDGLTAVGLSKSNPQLGEYGLSVPDDNLISVESRVLPAPGIKYSGDNDAFNTRTKWNLESKVLTRLRPESGKWVCKIIYLSPGNFNNQNYFSRCYEYFKANGVPIEDDKSPVAINKTSDEAYLEQELGKVFKSKAKSVDFVAVILSDSSKAIYSLIKRLGDIEYGVTTICIIGSTLRNAANRPASLAGNLALKLNLKFGNNNQAVKEESLGNIIDLGTTMIVGIDVTHSPMETAPSIAGMVASVDDHLGQWPAVLEPQEEKGAEMVEELEKMLKSRLELWKSRNKRYPENIVVYRDGVSEGQYKLVRDRELPKLRDACQTLYPKGQTPNLTIVVVGKRHHTRFYKQVTYNGDYNPEPGTIVDRGVTEALNWDFFLQSHFPLKGTARPAHYFVVHDEIFRKKFGKEAANKLETFTHSLCYMFGRSTNAVSICTPAYYADIVCQRARCYADGNPGMTSFEIHKNLKDTMFYI